MRLLHYALIALFVTGFAVSTRSQEHHHPAEHAQIHEQFYKTWMRPDMPTVSCCSLQDCGPAEARNVNGQWFARQVGKAEWLAIPPQKIEWNRDSPDGRNHLCSIGSNVFCFIAGAGG